MNKFRPAVLVASLLMAAGTVAAVLAAEPDDIIKYRQNVMKSQAAHLGAAAAIIQGKVDYKSQLAEHVHSLVATTKDIPSLFPKGSDFGDTEALDSVWKKPAEFDKLAKDAHEKAVALAKVVAAGDTKSYPVHFKALADTCKSCHKDFRKEQK